MIVDYEDLIKHIEQQYRHTLLDYENQLQMENDAMLLFILLNSLKDYVPDEDNISEAFNRHCPPDFKLKKFRLIVNIKVSMVQMDENPLCLKFMTDGDLEGETECVVYEAVIKEFNSASHDGSVVTKTTWDLLISFTSDQDGHVYRANELAKLYIETWNKYLSSKELRIISI